MTKAKTLLASFACALLGAAAMAPAAGADFSDIVWAGGAFNQDGTTNSQAAGHPYQGTTIFKIPSAAAGIASTNEDIKDVEVDLPPGFVGNPLATPTRCSAAELNEIDSNFTGCPPTSQVGVVEFYRSWFPVGELNPSRVALYNIVPPPGMPALLAFKIINVTALLVPRLRTGDDYGLTVTVPGAIQGQGVAGATVTLWGNTSDPSHDTDRGNDKGDSNYCAYEGSLGDPEGDAGPECTFPGILPGETPKAFLTAPSNCSAGPLTTTVRVNSWQAPGVIHTRSFSEDTNGNPTEVTGCDQVPFEPEITATPTADQAETPTGLDVDISVPTEGLLDPNGIAQGNLRKAVVTLPQGVSVNPASANGLGACSSAQIDLKGPNAANCPDNSKIGTVEVETPLIDHPLPGFVYLAAQNDNPFSSLLAIYIEVNDPQTGVVVKLAGHVVADPNTGQLTTTFDQNPQVPFEHFRVNLFGGPRGSLKTPSTCGSFTTTTQMTPWSAPEGASAAPSSTFAIGKGVGGGGCPGAPSSAPNNPSFSAGTLDPTAGIYSPFVLKLARADGSQQLKGIETTLPPGLTGKLAGTPYCPEAAIAAAGGKSGRSEQASPSCPLASQVGSVSVGAGVGSDPIYVPGKAYLAGPYKGAPLSMAVITPAVAGPFDLGNVVTRVALQVDEATAQIKAVSDPLPTILQGIPLELRSVSLRVDKPQFTLNPTSCDPMAVTGSALSVFSQETALSSPFQVGDCARLAFKPNLRLALKGGTKRDDHPALRSTLTFGKGNGANLKSATIILPPSEQIDNAHINNPCTRVQFNAGQCPKGSVLGHARAFSPLLENPLEGPVYFRSNGGERELPDIVADLNGQIHVIAVGFVDATKGRLRTTFATVPDAPISKVSIELKGGKKGLLVNNRDICARGYRFSLKLAAHNGRLSESSPELRTSCKAKAKKKAKKRGSGKKG